VTPASVKVMDRRYSALPQRTKQKYIVFDRFQFGLRRGGNHTILRATGAYPVGASYCPQ
jgi:hypothetical protein